MKHYNLVKAFVLCGLFVSANVFAENINTPDLLSDIPAYEIETLPDSEAADTRGERVKATIQVPGMCGWRPCMKTVSGTYTKRIYYMGRSYYVKH